MSLETKYLGITLRNPLIVGSSSLTDDVATVRELEDEGAAALVLGAARGNGLVARRDITRALNALLEPAFVVEQQAVCRDSL